MPAQSDSSQPPSPSMLIQAIVLGLMLLILSLMVSPITSLVEERQHRQQTAAREISETWGGSQRVAGPVLAIPGASRNARDRIRERLDRSGARRGPEVVLLPEALDIDVEVTPQERRRGIFTTLVYTAKITMKGHFRSEDLEGWSDQAAPELLFGPSDLRGLLASPDLRWNGESLDVEPLSDAHDLPLGTLRARGAPLTRSFPTSGNDEQEETEAEAVASSAELPDRLEFSAEIVLRGSGDLDFLPLGRETQVSMVSTWPHPSFHGAFLPSAPADVEDGVRGEWSVPHFARGYPQRLEMRPEDVMSLKRSLEASAFGVRLMKPIDFYQLVIRCTKYALLFAVLILGAFLVYELLSHLKLHPVQYLMVGSALTLFYLLLLALAEHVGFHTAFLLAASATTLLIGAYGASLLKSRARAAGLSATLATMYGVLFVIVQLQSYALLVGSFVLFALLAAAMWLTRNVDWHEALPVSRRREPEMADVEI